MKKNVLNDIRLGIFIISGLLILVVSLYLIGRNRNFFGSNFMLKARFGDVSGLMPGNNVRFSGIQCGTVEDIEIVNDTTIEVRILINRKTSRYIRSNARAAIGTEGLMGNKVINITPGTTDAPPMADGGMLHTGADKGLDDMMGALSATGDNALVISSDLKEVARRINNSPMLRDLLADTLIADDLRRSLQNFKEASGSIERAAVSVNEMVGEVQKGHGAAGVLLTDPKAAADVALAIANIRTASERADGLLANLDSLVKDLRADMDRGRGTAYLLLKDSLTARSVRNSLENIEKGTEAFGEDMEALKHNFLLRGYFRKQERRKSKVSDR